MGAPSISNVNTPGPNIANVPTTRVNLLGIDISFAQLASPPTDILANTAMVYQTPDGSLYQSNGTTLAVLGTGATRTFRGVVASQAAMLTLSASVVGDWCERSDLGNQVWELTTAGYAALANWTAYGAGGRTIAATRTATKMIAVKLFNGTTYNASAYGWVTGTFPLVNFLSFMDVEANFDQVALIFRNLSTVNTIAITKATIAMQPTAADLNGNGLTWTPITFAGSAGVTLPVAATIGTLAFETYAVSDFMPISTVARTDIVGGRPIIGVRTQITPVAGTDIISTVTRGGTGYSTYPDSLSRYYAGVYKSSAGDITSGAFGTSATAAGLGGPHVGFVYRARNGRVLTVFAGGDSETGDTGSSLGPTWLDKMCCTVSGGQTTAMGTTPVERCFWGYAGTIPSNYKQIFDAIRTFPAIPFNVYIHQGFSPNGSANQAQAIPYLVEIAGKCDVAGIYPMTWTGYPASTITTLGADQIRIAYNTVMASMDVALMDFQSVITDNGTGSRTPIASITPAYTADSLHLNDAGSTLVAAVGATKLAAIAATYFAAKTY